MSAHEHSRHAHVAPTHPGVHTHGNGNVAATPVVAAGTPWTHVGAGVAVAVGAAVAVAVAVGTLVAEGVADGVAHGGPLGKHPHTS